MPPIVEITLAGSGIVVTIPKVYEYDKCRGCGSDDLVWATTRNGKAMPIHWTETGWICHFEDCPKADKFRKGKKE